MSGISDEYLFKQFNEAVEQGKHENKPLEYFNMLLEHLESELGRHCKCPMKKMPTGEMIKSCTC